MASSAPATSCFEDRVPLRASATCVEHVVSLPPTADAKNLVDEQALAALHEREAALLQKLMVMGAAVEAAEDAAHGVLRADNKEPSLDGPSDLAPLRARAHARIEEWAAALGGGRVTLSRALTLPPHAPGAAPLIECRREAWVVQLYAKSRRIQVAAARLSALPPEGVSSQLIDVTWLDAVGGTDGVHHGLPRLEAMLAATVPPVASYDLHAVSGALRRLAAPPLDYAHLSAQPCIAARGGEALCAPWQRLVAAVGAELAAWARLEEPLGASDAAMDALHYARLHPPTGPGSAADVTASPRGRAAAPAAASGTAGGAGAGAAGGTRADLAVAWWARLDLYLASAFLMHAELGLRPWLANANASLRAYPAGLADDALDAPTPLHLVLKLLRHPRADEERKERAARLLKWVCSAPEPVGAQVAAVVGAAAGGEGVLEIA